MNEFKIMGVLNLTPDSFYDGDSSLISNKTSLLNQLNQLSQADIIDIGCESSRPGSNSISEKEEMERLSCCVDFIKDYDNIFSIDTYKYNIAKYALENGFKIINDIYAGRYENDKMLQLASEYSCPIILMHMKGKPINMQENTKYNSIIDDILYFFDERIKKAHKYGISDNNIIIDPGIGFGKSFNDNFKIIKNINKFKCLGYRVLIGLSRKSFLTYEKDSPNDRLSATISMNTLSLLNGVDIIRVHDVLDNIKMMNVLRQYISC
tara:strand:+ start:139 stop:933 length:795 start_codon:yes stop_codon:yes gene_type:complete